MSKQHLDSPSVLAVAKQFKNEDALVEKVREHLREAARNSAINKMTFEFEFNRGGVTKSHIDLEVRYRYLENSPAV